MSTRRGVRSWLGVLSLLLVAGPALAQDTNGEKVRLSVASQPSEASVYVRYESEGSQEKYKGKTPSVGPLELQLDPGTAEIVVFKNGYVCKVETLLLRKGGAARLEVRLTKDIKIPRAMTLKGAPNFVRSPKQSEELYISVMAHIVRYFVEERDPRLLVESSVKTLIEVLNAVRSREILLRRELPPDARRRYYGEELDLRTYPQLDFKRKALGGGRDSYTLGAGATAVTGTTDRANPDSYLAMLWRVYAFLKKKWDTRRILSDAILTRIAIEGQIAALDDDHTHFLTPDDVREMNVDTTGTFGGVGIVVSRRGGRLTVVAPMEGTPAQRAGILSGDWIAAIDGASTRRLSMKQCIDRMRGKVDTPIELTIRRGDRELTFTILRAQIKIKHTARRMLEGGVETLRISSFMHEHLAEDVERALQFLQKQGGRALVLDLRNNPGGLLPQAHKIANLFVKAGVIVSTRTRMTGAGRTLYADPNQQKYVMPMVVLINKGSASASEIVAGTLKEYELATVIGQKSFGKGSVQRVLPLDPYECAIALTVATYHLKSGATPHKRGITPHLTIELSEDQAIRLAGQHNYEWDAEAASKDPQLREAVKLLKGKLAEQPNKKKPQKD